MTLRLAVLALCIAGSAHAGALDVPDLDRAIHYRPKLPLQVLTADGVESWPDSPKDEVARKLVARAAEHMANTQVDV